MNIPIPCTYIYTHVHVPFTTSTIYIVHVLYVITGQTGFTANVMLAQTLYKNQLNHTTSGRIHTSFCIPPTELDEHRKVTLHKTLPLYRSIRSYRRNTLHQKPTGDLPPRVSCRRTALLIRPLAWIYDRSCTCTSLRGNREHDVAKKGCSCLSMVTPRSELLASKVYTYVGAAQLHPFIHPPSPSPNSRLMCRRTGCRRD